MRLMDPIRTSLNGRPFLDYALLDFGTVSKGTLYVQANPFGSSPVLVTMQLEIDGQWLEVCPASAAGTGSSSYGCFAGVSNGEIAVKTGVSGVWGISHSMFPLKSSGSTKASARCRVHVWRVGA